MNDYYTEPSLIRLIYRWRSPWRRWVMRARWFARGIALRGIIKCVQPGEGCEEPIGDQGFAVLCQFKNGALYLDAFIQHYLALGASHLVFLDNGSSDESREIISRYPQVRLLSAVVDYYDYLVPIRHYLKRKYAKKAWALSVDIDEFFDFPGSSTISMHDFLGYLNGRGYNAVHGYMLERFGRHPIGEAGSRPGDDLNSKYPYYDLEDIRRIPLTPADIGPKGSNDNQEIQHYMGGVRMRLLDSSPFLSKFPLARQGCGQMVGVHRIYNAKIADVSAVLNHYRFLDDLEDVAKNFAVNDRGRYNAFLEVCAKGESMCPYRDGAKSWRGTEALVEEGFLVESTGYRSWVDAQGEEST